MTMVLDPSWLQRLEAQVDAPPVAPRAPLGVLVGASPSAAVIGSIDATLALRLAGAGLPLRDSGEAWQIEVPNTAAIDPTLAAIAHWLHANGLAGGWRNELLAVVDAAGQPIGTVERAVVRPLGIATHAVHLVVRDPDGAAWVQQRAFDKAVDPGLWDTTMGGLVAAGESIAATLARETWEEAGLRLDALAEIRSLGRVTVRRPVADGYMVEHIEVFDALAPIDLLPVNQDGEVARFERLARPALIARLHADAFTIEAALILAQAVKRAGQSAR